jgi:uncharacterized membrane protein YadS
MSKLRNNQAVLELLCLCVILFLERQFLGGSCAKNSKGLASFVGCGFGVCGGCTVERLR